MYRWQRGEQLERKQRSRKPLPEECVENAASVIGTFPHFSGRKGQGYMLYHQLGVIGEKAYERIKQSVRHLLLQEAGRRNLFGEKSFYEHLRPTKVGEIWAEDFTELVVEGYSFKAALLLLDVFDQYWEPRWLAAPRRHWSANRSTRPCRPTAVRDRTNSCSATTAANTSASNMMNCSRARRSCIVGSPPVSPNTTGRWKVT
jgi:hypothetical protein